MYEVIENAGMDNQTQVEVFQTLKEARNYIKEFYSDDEIEDMSIDITFNGSTEY